MNNIDLSKIPVKETAKQVIKANFEGTEKEYTIRALNDGEKLNLTVMLTKRDVMAVKNLYVMLLVCGMDIEQSVAEYLFDNVNAEAIRVGEQISKLSEMFETAKKKEAESAEKNSDKGAGKP